MKRNESKNIIKQKSKKIRKKLKRCSHFNKSCSFLWTPKEDQILLEKAKKYNYKNWSVIASFLKGKSSAQCSGRYSRLKPGIIKGKWQKEEDEKLLKLYKKYGPDWSAISKNFPQRTGKQIRDRYINRLDKNANKSQFTEREDEIIVNLIKRYGHQWTKIATKLFGRTGDMVKNRFYSKLKYIIEEKENENKNKLLGKKRELSSKKENTSSETKQKKKNININFSNNNKKEKVANSSQFQFKLRKKDKIINDTIIKKKKTKIIEKNEEIEKQNNKDRLNRKNNKELKFEKDNIIINIDSENRNTNRITFLYKLEYSFSVINNVFSNYNKNFIFFDNYSKNNINSELINKVNNKYKKFANLETKSFNFFIKNESNHKKMKEKFDYQIYLLEKLA